MAKGNTVNKYGLLLIGGSAGSLDALLQFLPSLPVLSGLAIVVVLHRRSGESLLPELLADRTAWAVKEAEDKEVIDAGTIYLAPADYHLLVERNKTFSLDYSEKVNYSRPSIDVTFESAADVYGAAVMALLLSGANQDGTEGLKKIKEAGGYVMVQNPVEAVVSYMPQHALESMQLDMVVAVADVPALVQRLLLP
jgi:two-component system, chemotaxis family, protein-glutamate methylesterase/glutaminase